MKNEETIDVLNTLITINNDRIAGYETASEGTEDQDLRALFSRFVATSHQIKQELVNEVSQLGGEIADGTKATGKVFRIWMDVKAALTGKDRKAILDSCAFGEDKASEVYDNALANSHDKLSPAQRNMLIGQQSLLKADRDHIILLRQALKVA